MCQKRTLARPTAAAPATLVDAQAILAGLRNSDSFDLKLPVEPPGKDIHWPAVGVVGGVSDVLIVKADFRRWGDGVAVVRLDDLFERGMRQLPVADDNTQTSCIEIGGVDAGSAVEDTLRDQILLSGAAKTQQPAPA